MKVFALSIFLLFQPATPAYLRSPNEDVPVYIEDHPVVVTGEAQNSTAYQRALFTSSTSRSILVLRVINDGKAPTVSSSDLKRYLFTDQNSLDSQMKRCSADALGFYASHLGSGGVADVQVNTNYEAQSMINAAIRDGARAVGVSNLRTAADHVMFVLPELHDAYFATAEVGNVFSFFNNEKAVSLSVLMHELGHNLNLHHAGINGDEYGDYSVCCSEATFF